MRRMVLLALYSLRSVCLRASPCRRDGSVARVDIDELAGHLQREARAMRRGLLVRWSRGALRCLASAAG